MRAMLKERMLDAIREQDLVYGMTPAYQAALTPVTPGGSFIIACIRGDLPVIRHMLQTHIKRELIVIGTNCAGLHQHIDILSYLGTKITYDVSDLDQTYKGLVRMFGNIDKLKPILLWYENRGC